MGCCEQDRVQKGIVHLNEILHGPVPKTSEDDRPLTVRCQDDPGWDFGMTNVTCTESPRASCCICSAAVCYIVVCHILLKPADERRLSKWKTQQSNSSFLNRQSFKSLVSSGPHLWKCRYDCNDMCLLE